MIIGHIIVFFLAGFCMFYWRAKGGKADGILVAIQLAVFIGGVYFLGWWALATIFAGMVLGPVLARPQ